MEFIVPKLNCACCVRKISRKCIQQDFFTRVPNIVFGISRRLKRPFQILRRSFSLFNTTRKKILNRLRVMKEREIRYNFQIRNFTPNLSMN